MKENIKLICLDLDQTLIYRNSWRTLGLALGIPAEEDIRLYKEYKAGLFSYDEWNEKVLEFYTKHEDANREGITKILADYTFVDGAREAVEYLKSKGYELVLISGSIDILVDVVAKDLGIKYFKANNTFIFDENDRLISIHSGGDDTLAKAGYLESFCEMLGFDITECACIGDGSNDLEMFRRTGHGITFKGGRIEKDAWKVIDNFYDIKNIF